MHCWQERPGAESRPAEEGGARAAWPPGQVEGSPGRHRPSLPLLYLPAAGSAGWHRCHCTLQKLCARAVYAVSLDVFQLS